ncbi:MAG TPA: metalloregulator ArsR/SmtB family transcription factor [Polyangia bacterium]|nr:metalloregulator ArsR/SmtB family transcription factor [Polyangia bacterium]
MLSALGDPTRRLVFERLATGPRSVGEIHRGLPHVSRPAVSQHLRVLKDAALVLDEGVGTRRYYRPNPVAVRALRAYFDRLWGDALDSFSTHAEETAAAPPRPRRKKP